MPRTKSELPVPAPARTYGRGIFAARPVLPPAAAVVPWSRSPSDRKGLPPWHPLPRSHHDCGRRWPWCSTPTASSPTRPGCTPPHGRPDFSGLLATHSTAWEALWARAEPDVPNEAGNVLRLHLFHVLQTLSPHTAALDAGVPARGLHGEAYRGHVFWDELIVLPYLNLHFPEVSRGLLAYRHRRWAPRADRRPRPGTRARCTRGRAAATAGRKLRHCT